MKRPVSTIAAVMAGALLFGGCSIRPWVKPYEREQLADPIMASDRDPLFTKYRQHVFDTREGARGAGSAQGGSCGCN